MRVPIDDVGDDFIEVEVDMRDLAGPVQLTASGPEVATAPFSLASSIQRITPALGTIIHGLRAVEPAPVEISMELGLTIGGEIGVVFAKGTSEATFAVTVSWRNAVDAA